MSTQTITAEQAEGLKSLDTPTVIIIAQINAAFREAAAEVIFARTGGWVRITDGGVIPIDHPGQTFRPLTAEERAEEARKTAEAERIEREG